ncbi:hypothetical protein E2C01_028026 [Portunus trituberculatus]|uniref:Uncharacterized protein n=1 Tax=Portunus trituberculatus TaxID=210409 RepID=A0A5B7EJG5_PORTR|nr:hypothetical protein [Portunus trituberculatus]
MGLSEWRNIRWTRRVLWSGIAGKRSQSRAQCMDVNARNCMWSESHGRVCQMCDMREDEMVEHVMLECERYERDRREMMRVILTERVKKRGREWMVLLLQLCTMSERMIDAVTEFLKRMWRVRCRDN